MSSENNQKIDDILKFWFGRVEETIVPSEHRARVWFAEDEATDQEIKNLFLEDLNRAVEGQYCEWENVPRGQLALILLFDQFSRHLFRNNIQAYAADSEALRICIDGIRQQNDHELSLIERVFYYFPLLHSENLSYQEQAIRAYQILSELAFSETRVIYDSFLKFAHHHYSIIERFGRFPQRNLILGRESREEEIVYLKEIGAGSASSE